MPAFASIEITPVPLSRNSVLVGVYRYRPDQSPKYESLPNIRVLNVRYREGADSGVARFRYVLDAGNSATDPIHFQDALSTDSSLPGVVQNDERLVVFTFTPDGGRCAIFDGFAQVPELDLSSDQELVTFLAYGVAIREWDTPIGGALMRDADAPTVVSDVATDLVTHFNPQGQPNATPAGTDATDKSGNQYPTFLDPLVIRNPDVRRYWSLPMAARYLCYYHNPDQSYVTNPDGSILDALLDSRSPQYGVALLPNNPATYTSQAIIVPDFPTTGKVWPVVLHEMLDPNGFGMSFRIQTDANGDPYTALEIFRRQDGDSGTYKDLYLQSYGGTLTAQSNVGQAHIARDHTGIANTYTIDSDLIQFEASFVLAPGFPISASDALHAMSISSFDRNDQAFPQTNHDRYRLYIIDETGEGHWDVDSASMVNTVPSLQPLLGNEKHESTTLVKRRRIPLGELISTDPNQKPLKPRLAISTNYTGAKPGLWDGSGTWQTVMGGFELLQDRLGVWINVQNPNSWNIGASQLAGAAYPSGIVRGVENLADPTSVPFSLRLTCVIKGDKILSATANKRPASPTSFTISRRIDARDRYVKWIKGPRSEFNSGNDFVVVRDNGLSAQADADSRRLAGEAGEVAGTVTIPRFSTAYRISDKIRSIQGRGLTLRTNAGAPTEEGEVFPAVVGITWDFDERQQTVLDLSDRRGESR